MVTNGLTFLPGKEAAGGRHVFGMSYFRAPDPAMYEVGIRSAFSLTPVRSGCL